MGLFTHIIKKIEDEGNFPLYMLVGLFLGTIVMTGSENILKILEILQSNGIFGVFFSQPFWLVYAVFFGIISWGYIRILIGNKLETYVELKKVREKIEIEEKEIISANLFVKSKKAFIEVKTEKIEELKGDYKKIEKEWNSTVLKILQLPVPLFVFMIFVIACSGIDLPMFMTAFIVVLALATTLIMTMIPFTTSKKRGSVDEMLLNIADELATMKHNKIL